MNWSAISQLIRLPNQSGTLLLMLPTFWALLVASNGRPPFLLIVIFAAGAFLMRSAGVVLNDVADRSIDCHVERTKTRPLAAGTIGVPLALAIAVTLVSLAASLLAFLNTLTVLLSPIALLLAVVYPFSKRAVHIPQATLGIAFGWGVVMAWASVRDTLDQPVWWLFAATVFWAIAYDSIYAVQDREDDARLGVKSSAVLFGPMTWLAVAVSSLAMIVCLVISGYMAGVNPAFYSILVAVAVFLGVQSVSIRVAVSPLRALAMFKQHVWVGVAILAGFWLGFL